MSVARLGTRLRLGGGAVVLLTALGVAAPAHAADASSTTMVLSSTTTPYGQAVVATAAVSTSPGPPQGDVVFSVDGLALKTNLRAGGIATTVLPAAMVGDHAVTATFVPQFPLEQEGSTSPTTTWVVAPVRTRLQVRVIGRGARIPTSVRVGAQGDYGSRPTGRVKVVVERTRGPHRRRTKVVEQLDQGVVLADFGRLRKGRYRARVTYVGDSQHRREERVTRFRVRKR